MAKTIEYEVSVENGKYRFVYYTDGTGEAFRHKEPWPVMTESMIGSKVFFALVTRIAELEKGPESKANGTVCFEWDGYNNKFRVWCSFSPSDVFDLVTSADLVDCLRAYKHTGLVIVAGLPE